MEAAWRARDAEAYAGQFTEDAEHINAYGMWWRGRREIAEGIGFALNVVYRDNPIVARDVSLIPLGEDVALVQYRWRLNPYADPDGAQHDDPEGRVTQVVVRVARGWRIRAFQSTFINPNIPRGR
jgi:uncharacterized protein (TIGR02246 family)